MDYDRFAEDMVRPEPGTRWVKLTILGLLVLLLGLIAAFISDVAAQTRRAEPPTIAELRKLPESDFVTLIRWCRGSVQYAGIVTCANAEHAFNLRYAEALRKRRGHMMDSPLYWLANPISATHIGRLCDAGYRDVQRWCAPIRAATGKG